MTTKTRIISFTNLIAWQEGHRLVLFIYEVTKQFPKEELFGLGSQMRRAVVSITSSIAESFSHKTTKEKIQFYKTSIGSLLELQNQIIISRDLGLISEKMYKTIYAQTIMVQKIMHGLANKVPDDQCAKY